jgi:hypothetical protein
VHPPFRSKSARRSSPGSTAARPTIEATGFIVDVLSRTLQCSVQATRIAEGSEGADGKDPASVLGTEEARLVVLRRVRDEIARRVQMFLLANHVVDASTHGSS